MLRRAAFCLAVVLTALLPAPAHAQPSKLVEPGKLTWATSPTFAPYEVMKDGQFQGFDVDMMAALAKHAGLVSNPQAQDFKGIIPSLLGGRIDAAASGMYITPARQEVADFIPYMLIGNQLFAAHGNPKHVAGPEALCGRKIAVAVSTAFEASLKKASDACTAAAKPAIDLLSLPGSNLVALAVSQGRADAGLSSTATVSALMGQEPGTYEAVGTAFDATTKLGIVLRKDDPALKAALDQGLQAMVKDGSYAALMTKWGLPAAVSIF